MDNYFKITSSDQLNKIFENSQDKLVVILFFTKNNPECRKAIMFFEKSAANHSLSIFCVVDMDKFQGDSRYTSNISNMPKLECYHLGNSFGSCMTSNEKDIESCVRSGEQYVMTQNNMKNSNQNNGQMSQMPTNQMPINQMQIQQQILNNAQMQNPMQYQYLVQNPMVLQRMVQQQMQLIQQQMMQPQMVPQPMLMPQPQMPMQPQMVPQTPQINPAIPQTINPAINPTFFSAQIPSSTNSALPTLQQMQQMFQIFQMMQQMGILNTQQTTIPEPTVNNTESNKADDGTIILPNGDKIIPLANGKYGLVKKNQ